MSEQERVEEPLEQGPVTDAGPGSEGQATEEVVDATVVEEDSLAEGETPATEAEASDAEAAEDAEAETTQEAAEAEPEETPLERAERERGEYLELAQRSRAEFENFRKRAATQARDAEVRGKADLARRLLPAMDNLERALLAAGVDPSAGAPESEEGEGSALASGVALVHGEFRSALSASGVESFDPTGDRFDPTSHEAISTAQVEGAESGVIIETLEKGYRVGEQVLRPARVVVAG